jgi:cation transport regulator ChaC
MIHFAYGSNMSRKLMQRHAPLARPLGVARLAGHRFVITVDGYASVAPASGETVYGVAWQLTARDRVTLDAWENVAAGLYTGAVLPVQMEGRRVPALVYVGRRAAEGRAKPGYMELVIAAAREWQMPDRHMAVLKSWLPPAAASKSSMFKGPSRKFGETG